MATGLSRPGAGGGRERIFQEIDWGFLAALNSEEALLLLLSLLERSGLSEPTRQTLRAAMANTTIPIAAALSGRARSVLLRLLRIENALDEPELEILCQRLREKRSWSSEDVFDFLEALSFELSPHRACRVARVLPMLARTDRSRSLALWRRLMSHGSEGVRLVCLSLLLHQGEIEGDFVVDLVRQVVAEADPLLRIELAAAVPLDAPFSHRTVELLAAQWTEQQQYEPLGRLVGRLADGPVELLGAAFTASLDRGLLSGAPTMASVREAYTIPIYDLPALEEALEIEGGFYLEVLACLFKVSADPTAGLLVERVVKRLEPAQREGEEEQWSTWFRDSEVQRNLLSLIEAWGLREPGGARRLVLRLLEAQALEADLGEALAFRFEKTLCRAALERLADSVQYLPEGSSMGRDCTELLPKTILWWLSEDPLPQKIVLELPAATSLALEFLADPPDWLTGQVGLELAAERVRSVARPFPAGWLREVVLGIGKSMQAGPESKSWSVALTVLIELTERVWKDLEESYIAAESALESECPVRRAELTAWCGALPGSFFALLAHVGSQPGGTSVAGVGARLALAVAHLMSWDRERWPALPHLLPPELASYVCQQLATFSRKRTWAEICPDLGYFMKGMAER